MESDNDIRSQLTDNVAGNCSSMTETQYGNSSECTTSEIKKKNQPGDEEQDTRKKTYKSPKLAVESGNWICKYKWCITKDDSDKLACSKCKSKYHLNCAELPAYQIAMFRTTGYRKYVCNACTEVSIELSEKCKVDRNILNKMQAEPKHNATLLDKI